MLALPIAAKSYLQVTDDHFTEALQQPTVSPRTGSQSDWALSMQAPLLDTFRTVFNSQPLEFRIHYRAFQEGSRAA